MAFTVFSFITSAAVSTIVLVGVHLLRRNRFFVKGFGTRAVLLGYLLCLVRMMFTPEFPFTRVINSSGTLGSLYGAFCNKPALGTEVPYSTLFLVVWLTVAGVLVAVFCVRYIMGLMRIERRAAEVIPGADEVLRRVQSEYPRKVEAQVLSCPGISTPMGIGICHKKILLPAGEFPERQLYHMIKHEYTHFYNRDLTVKFLVMLFCCVFWWNPLVYLLSRDVSQMLEVKCDLTVTAGYGPDETEEYLAVILSLLKDQDGREAPSLGLGMAGAWSSKAMLERFDAVISPAKKASKAAGAAVVAVFIAVFALSYTVVVQPDYDPPAGAILSDDGAEDPMLTGYIWKDPDGNYFMCSPGEDPWPIKEETAEVFASTGIEIKEEMQDEKQTD